MQQVEHSMVYFWAERGLISRETVVLRRWESVTG